MAHAASLSDNISTAIAGFHGTVSIFAKNLDTGATFSLRPDERVRTASTIKLPILCATFEAVKEGRLKWTDLVTLHDSDKVSGSGILGEFSDGMKFPLVDLTHLMIVVSDNTATNLVLDQVTSDYVNEYMDKLGLKGTRSMRKVRGDGADLKSRERIQQGGARSGESEIRPGFVDAAGDGDDSGAPRKRRNCQSGGVERNSEGPEAAKRTTTESRGGWRGWWWRTKQARSIICGAMQGSCTRKAIGSRWRSRARTCRNRLVVG